MELSRGFLLGVLLIGDKDYLPSGVGDWTAADNPVAIGTQALAVRVVNGQFGVCRVRLLDQPEQARGHLYFDGMVSIDSGHFWIGDTPDQTSLEQLVSGGEHRIRVHANKPREADELDVVLFS